MAIAFELVYQYQDDAGNVATEAAKIPTGFTLAQYTEFGRSLAALKDAVVGGVIIDLGLRVAVDISALTGNISTVTSDVEDVAAFAFRTADNRKVRVNVPCADELDVLANSNDLNQSDTEIAAFISAMENGVAVTGGTMIPSDVGEDAITAIVTAREAFRPSGRSS